MASTHTKLRWNLLLLHVGLHRQLYKSNFEFFSSFIHFFTYELLRCACDVERNFNAVEGAVHQFFSVAAQLFFQVPGDRENLKYVPLLQGPSLYSDVQEISIEVGDGVGVKTF